MKDPRHQVGRRSEERPSAASAVPIAVGRSAASAAEGMSIPRRNSSVAGTYFVTSRTSESRRLFVVETGCDVFVNDLPTRAQNKALERCLQLVEGGSAHAIGKTRHKQSPVGQRGFSDRHVGDAADHDNHVRYIERNPVRKRFVTAAAEFRWSSAFHMIPMDIAPQGLKPQERAVAGRHG